MWESPPWYRVMIYILHTPKDFHTDSKLSNYARVGIVCPLKTKKLGFGTRWWMIMIMTQKPYERKRERDELECPWESFFFNLYIYQRLHMEHVNGTTLNHRHQSLTPHSNYNNKRCHVHVPITKGVTGIQKNTHTLNSDLFTTKKTRKKTRTHTDPSFKRNK